jgi:hypothetical protein
MASFNHITSFSVFFGRNTKKKTAIKFHIPGKQLLDYKTNNKFIYSVEWARKKKRSRIKDGHYI